jgi:hypothetical protein
MEAKRRQPEPQQRCADSQIACNACNGFGFTYVRDGLFITQPTCKACGATGIDFKNENAWKESRQ